MKSFVFQDVVFSPRLENFNAAILLIELNNMKELWLKTHTKQHFENQIKLGSFLESSYSKYVDAFNQLCSCIYGISTIQADVYMWVNLSVFDILYIMLSCFEVNLKPEPGQTDYMLVINIPGWEI